MIDLPTNGKYQWLPILYEVVKTIEPKKIVELGTGKGTTTVTMALACKENNIDVTINSYDMWEDVYWGSYHNTLDNFKRWGVLEYINLYEKDFYNWLKTDEKFDLLYFDIDNNGNNLLELYDKIQPQIENGSVVIFEGGSEVRDTVPQMYDKIKMNEVKDKTNYKLLTDNIKYSASIIYSDQIYELEF
jgi:predicted O-methyltransferase YrrM|tara:strand:+ start:124 stop:687 length:564 start_codon:yes stop_codon:yes gene_type:complete